MKTLIFLVVIILLPFKIQAQLEPNLNLEVKKGDHLFTWKLNEKKQFDRIEKFFGAFTNSPKSTPDLSLIYKEDATKQNCITIFLENMNIIISYDSLINNKYIHSGIIIVVTGKDKVEKSMKYFIKSGMVKVSQQAGSIEFINLNVEVDMSRKI